MPDKHAKLSASSSHRWLECPPSMRLEETMPEAKSSEYAQEGTLAHSICEAKLRKLAGEKRVRTPKAADDEMTRCTDAYRDFVQEEWAALKADTPDAALFIEQELQFDEYVPEGFGTSDAVLASDKLLVVIDFKYGKGVPVSAENNPQLRLYALGAYLKFHMLYDFEQVKSVVFQPRLDAVTAEVYSVDELLDWAENYVKPRARLAWDGEGEFCPGDHCRFCRASALCRARAEEAFKVIDHDQVSPPLLDEEEIPDILDRLDSAIAWAESVKAYAQEQAIAGHKWEGYKLVEARTQRRITDQLAAIEALEKEDYDISDVTNTKLKGLTDLQKLMGKKEFERILTPFIEKPKGDPVLVKESDKRPEIKPLEEIFKEDDECLPF